MPHAFFALTFLMTLWFSDGHHETLSVSVQNVKQCDDLNIEFVGILANNAADMGIVGAKSECHVASLGSKPA